VAVFVALHETWAALFPANTTVCFSFVYLPRAGSE
jgi:hypothetical protein